jgi:hypothetical protein
MKNDGTAFGELIAVNSCMDNIEQTNCMAAAGQRLTQHKNV